MSSVISASRYKLAAQIHTQAFDFADPRIVACGGQKGIKVEPAACFAGSNGCFGSDWGSGPCTGHLSRAGRHVEKIGKVYVCRRGLQTK